MPRTRGRNLSRPTPRRSLINLGVASPTGGTAFRLWLVRRILMNVCLCHFYHLTHYVLLQDPMITYSILGPTCLLSTSRDLENVKSIQPIKVSGISGGVTATQSGTHRLFRECLYAPDCRLSLISYHKLMERYSMVFDSEVGDLFTMTPKDPASDLPVLTFAPGQDRLYHLCYDWLQCMVHHSAITLLGIPTLRGPRRKSIEREVYSSCMTD